jgi:hypothetical protein
MSDAERYNDKVERVIASLKRAEEVVFGLCQGNKWRMSIPVQPDDTDIVIADALRDAIELLSARSSTGDTTPQESPLAWVVFTPNDPQGFDYRVFPEEREARSWASNDADSTFEPLYRASAFTRSANVPREPTEEMQKAMVAALFDLDHSDLKLKDAYKMVRKAYRAAMAVVDRRMNDG